MKEVLVSIGNMENWKLSKKIGVIAEDNSDIEVINEIISKYLPQEEYKIKKFVGNGCGKLRNKCDSWTNNLFKSGCEYVFIFHDLDRYKEKELRRTLENKVCPKVNPKSLIVIPKEELEAWLLSDAKALKKVFGLEKEPKKISNCEVIESPKEHIRDLMYKLGKKRYLNTVHNKKIAKETCLSNFQRCKSFKPFGDFITDNLCA
jgi:hypothetical protein